MGASVFCVPVSEAVEGKLHVVAALEIVGDVEDAKGQALLGIERIGAFLKSRRIIPAFAVRVSDLEAAERAVVVQAHLKGIEG